MFARLFWTLLAAILFPVKLVFFMNNMLYGYTIGYIQGLNKELRGTR